MRGHAAQGEHCGGKQNANAAPGANALIEQQDEFLASLHGRVFAAIIEQFVLGEAAKKFPLVEGELRAENRFRTPLGCHIDETADRHLGVVTRTRRQGQRAEQGRDIGHRHAQAVVSAGLSEQLRQRAQLSASNSLASDSPSFSIGPWPKRNQWRRSALVYSFIP